MLSHCLLSLKPLVCKFVKLRLGLPCQIPAPWCHRRLDSEIGKKGTSFCSFSVFVTIIPAEFLYLRSGSFFLFRTYFFLSTSRSSFIMLSLHPLPPRDASAVWWTVFLQRSRSWRLGSVFQVPEVPAPKPSALSLENWAISKLQSSITPASSLRSPIPHP